MSVKRTRVSKQKFKFLWITDPWDTLDHPRDTTLRLAEEALALGAEAHWADVRSIRWDRSEVLLDTQQILTIYPGRSAKAYRLSEPCASRPDQFQSIHYRTDPPVDLAYLHPLQLLISALGSAELVNPGPLLCMGNEKLEASSFGLMPITTVSAQWEKLLEFGLSEGKTVLKPLHQAQSKGIELLDWRTKPGMETARKSLQAASDDFSRPVLLQRYLAGIAQGEQRLWYIDGTLLACVRKLPLPNDFRVNLDGGSRVVQTELSASERKAATRIGKFLRAEKIRLAAVDLIDGFVTDFNFTSPGLIPQMEGILGKNLARPIIEALMGRS